VQINVKYTFKRTRPIIISLIGDQITIRNRSRTYKSVRSAVNFSLDLAWQMKKLVGRQHGKAMDSRYTHDVCTRGAGKVWSEMWVGREDWQNNCQPRTRIMQPQGVAVTL
jgi:hypothetical protein